MSELVPGFRFYPTEEELVSFYLVHKLQAQRQDIELVVPVVDVYRHEPWQLPGVSGTLCRGDMEQWFFFVPQQEREARGGRPTRVTPAGYWKATGSPSYVYSTDNRVIGLKKTMVFYKGRCPNVQKTKWKMNEYRAIQEERAVTTDESSDAVVRKVRYEYSLCRVYVVSGKLRAFDRRPQAAIAMRNINTHSHAFGGAQGEDNASIDGSTQMNGTSDDPSSASGIEITTDWGRLMNK